MENPSRGLINGSALRCSRVLPRRCAGDVKDFAAVLRRAPWWRQ